MLDLPIYLDTCCLKRPFDDQTQPRIHLEAEAVLWILRQVDSGIYSLVGSEILGVENARDPNVQRQNRVQALIERASVKMRLAANLRRRADMLSRVGFRPVDALHIVSAEGAGASVFLSCDDQLLRVAEGNSKALKVRVMNPIDFVRGVSNDE